MLEKEKYSKKLTKCWRKRNIRNKWKWRNRNIKLNKYVNVGEVEIFQKKCW